MPKRTREKEPGYKYAQIKTDLSIQILEGKLRAHDRIPSLNDITSKYKVSKITARRVLNDLVNEGLVYASRGRGSFVADIGARRKAKAAKERTNQIGVVFEHATGQFMSDIIAGIDEEAFEHGIQVSLSLSNNSPEREAENLQRLADQGVQQLILFMVLQNDERAINPNIPLYLKLQEQGLRILLLACEVPGFPIPSIVYDDYNAYRRLVFHMKENRCRRPLYIMRSDNASTSSERLRGFKDGLLEGGLSWERKRLVHVPITTVENLVSDSMDSFTALIDSDEPFDSVICSDEMVAAGVFEAMDAAGLQERRRPPVGGMGSKRNLHVLRGNPYILLEDDTRRLGREAAALVTGDDFPDSSAQHLDSLRRVIPVPLKVIHGATRRGL